MKASTKFFKDINRESTFNLSGIEVRMAKYSLSGVRIVLQTLDADFALELSNQDALRLINNISDRLVRNVPDIATERMPCPSGRCKKLGATVDELSKRVCVKENCGFIYSTCAGVIEP